jgi:hypothetical protein
VLVVAAAGNNGKNVDIDPVYPCCYPENNIIGVATSDNQDNPASWSNNGVASVDIFAPGVDILSLGMHNSYIGHNAIYRDVNNPGKVSAGDIRLTNYTLPGMKHGVVNADDGDVGFPLKKFGDLERHTENIDTNNRYDHGEYIYNDTDNTGTVTKGDFRLMWMEWRGTWYRTGSIVWTGDEDLQTPRIPLFDFIDDETYAIYAYMNGTSMATPHVSGALAHFWSLFPNLEHTQVKDWLMRITRVDPRPNLDNMVHYGKNRDARLRMICGDDFGDAKDTYTGDNHKYPVKERYTGGGHEDIGEEWLGNITESGDVTPEFDADLKYPYDVDKTHSNNEPRRKPDNPEPPYQKTCSVWDKDSYDDGIKIENPLIIGGTNTIKYSIMTENEDIVDSEGGRYRGTDKTNVYINIWIDWNNDGDWEDTNEHVWRKSHNPTAEWKGEHCSGWLPASFIVPHDLENGIYNLRARLDYGEDVGKYKLYDSDDALVRSFGLAQYGEVEDYCVRVMHPLVRTREKFEMFPPDDWEELVYNGDGHWEATKDALYPPYGWSGSCFIAANSHVHPDKIYDVELFTPPIDMTGFEAVALECDGNMQNPLGVEGIAAINIYSGVDKVLEWQPYFSMGDPDVGGMHHAYTFAPGSYTDPSHVQIGFYYSTAGATDAYNFAVDNLNISDAMGDTIFFDDFNGYCDAVGFPPDGWELVQTTEEVTDGHPCYWHGSDYMAGEGQYSAGLWWGTQLQDEWLISPTIDLSGDISGAFLDFWTYNYGYSQSFWEGDYVKVSTNGGITWDKLGNLYEEAQAYPSGFLGERVQYDLSDYVGRSNLQIAFHRYTVESYPNLGFWFIDDFIIYVIPSSEPPNTPVISGPTTGSPGNEYTYSISLIDPENDDVFLYVDWDDGNIIDWFGSFDSGETAEIGHTWDEKGTYIIKAKVKDFYNAESDWGTLTVTMPRNRAININSLFLRFLEHFPILQKILCYIL